MPKYLSAASPSQIEKVTSSMLEDDEDSTHIAEYLREVEIGEMSDEEYAALVYERPIIPKD